MRGDRVLVIDDSKVMVARIAHELQAGGYDVITAENGYRGIDSAIQNRPALIICDYTLPGMTGDRILEKLKSDPATQAIPVIVYSSQADENVVDACTKAGASAHLQKTGDYAALIRKIRDLLGEGDFEVEF